MSFASKTSSSLNTWAIQSLTKLKDKSKTVRLLVRSLMVGTS